VGDPDYKQKRRARRKRNLIAKDALRADGLRSPRFRHQVKPDKIYKRIRELDDGLCGDEDGPAGS
jgi:hypothetical protein